MFRNLSRYFSIKTSLDLQSKFLGACQLGRTEYISELLKEKNLDPAFNSNEAFREAVVKGHTDAVKILLKDPRIDPAAEVNEGLRFACFLGHLEIVDLLLKDSRVDPSVLNNEAIRMAKQRGYTRIIERLLKDSRVDPKALNNKIGKVASLSRVINSTVGMTEFSKDLGDKKKVTVSVFKGKPLVHIREYYTDNGQEKPGKKGIALSLSAWKALLDLIPQIDSAINNVSAEKSSKSASKAKEEA